MSLYKLEYNKNNLSDGFMQRANKEAIDYEKDFENWLENSPHVLFENENDTIMWIGRQVTITSYDNVKFPDLLGIDSEGNVVVVELKKGKTPREVVAQLLEYVAWASKLSYEELNVLTLKYYDRKSEYIGMELAEIHKQIFGIEEDIVDESIFNRSQKLYIVAEEISKTVKEVVDFLNNKSDLNITFIKYDVYKANNDEIYISTEVDEPTIITGSAQKKKEISVSGWNGDVPIHDIVRDSVDEILKNKKDGIFTGKEVIKKIFEQYPDCNEKSIRPYITADCVNHTSRKHYKSGQIDYYYLIEKGKYRLYDKEKDGKWNSEGKKISD